jgi:hypothetical protein
MSSDSKDSKKETTSDDAKLEPLQRLRRLAQYFKKAEKPKQEQTEASQPELKENQVETTKEESAMNKVVESLLRPKEEIEAESRRSFSFEDFVDERTLLSHDVLGKKEMKIKVLEVSDEHPPLQWKFGDRVKVNKILVTIKHLDTQEVEEAEFDIETIEKELIEKRHYTSTNRWIPTNEIKNGYVVGARHTSLISDAVALDYIQF